MHAIPATLAIPGYLPGTWKADPAHSEIAFALRQFAVGKVRGRFTGYDITLVTGRTPAASRVTATLDLASIGTGNQRRDDHLRSTDWFGNGPPPKVTYRSTDIRRTDEGWTVDGDLTLYGVTRHVPLAVAVNGFRTTLSGTRQAEFSATAHISRRDFGMRLPMRAGGAVIGDKVAVSLTVQAVRQD